MFLYYLCSLGGLTTKFKAWYTIIDFKSLKPSGVSTNFVANSNYNNNVSASQKQLHSNGLAHVR